MSSISEFCEKWYYAVQLTLNFLWEDKMVQKNLVFLNFLEDGISLFSTQCSWKERHALNQVAYFLISAKKISHYLVNTQFSLKR